MPCPASSTTSVAGLATGAAAMMAAARGWVLVASTAAAQASRSSRVIPGAGWTSTTVGSLRVRVPVLSRATARIVPSCSNASPDLMTTPNFDAAPIALITVTGTAMASAHGDAATRTTRARSIQVHGSPTSSPNRATTAAAIRTTGTSGFAIRSARRARLPLRAWACSTRATIWVRELSRPSAVASIRNVAAPLTEPAATGSPGPTSTGIDSPVIADVSRLDLPSTTTPSVAMRSPAPMTRMSSSRTSAAGIVTSLVRRETRTVSGMRDRRARKPSLARSIARSSSASARENRNARVAASPTWPSRTAPIAAMVISSPTPRRPRMRRRIAPGTKV